MRLIWTTAFCLALLASPANAQDFNDLFSVDKEESSFQVGGAKEAKVSASLKKGTKKGVVIFELKLTIPEGSNSYSQAKDFPKPTVIKLAGIDGWTALGDGFKPNPKPKRAFDEVFGKEVEKLVGTTTFTRRYLAPQGRDVKDAKFTGKVDLLLCDKGSCTPKSFKFTATLTGAKKADAQATVITIPAKESPVTTIPPGKPVEVPAVVKEVAKETVQPPSETQASEFTYGYAITPKRKVGGDDPVQLQFELTPSDPKQDDEVTLSITMRLFDGWNTYGLVKGETQIENPTKLSVTEVTGLESISGFTPNQSPELHESSTGVSNVHRDQVTWSQKFRVTDPENIGLSGKISYQICKKSCLGPLPVAFSLGSLQRDSHVASAVAPTEIIVKEGIDESETQVAESLPEEDLFAVETEGKVESLFIALPLAFLGGLLLNIMPCVLPVLAIKILSLVQQAGESRSRVLALNLSYTAGVLSVFFILAVVSAAIGWGGQFQNQNYAIVMSIIVFAMGLSLLGVFELPIPGLIPSANEHSEGLFGAFNTGIIATLLATPCTGPFMGVVIAYAASQPTAINFLIFGVMGLGMSSPYVMAGFFPRIVDWLPRPGMWMVRFKQFSGFVLMGTVIWLMNVSIDASAHAPVMILLLGIALLLWMIGLNSHTGKSLFGKPLAIATLVSAPVIAYGIYDIGQGTAGPVEERIAEVNPASVSPADVDEMPWEPFSEERMFELRQKGTPMLIDFTADWCGVCKTNELWALNRKPTVEFVRKHGVVTMVADYTKQDTEIRKWLEKFGVESVPLVVIFPADKTRKAIAISGPYTMDGIIERLETAVSPTQTAKAAKDGSKVSLVEENHQ